MRKALLWAAITVGGLVAPATVLAQGLMVSGYASEEFEWFQRTASASDPRTSRNYFDAQNFNLILLGQLRGDVFAAVEVEYEHGGEEIEFEYGYLAFTRWPSANIVVGKFLVPFGRFNADLHPAWVNRIPGRPLPNDAVLPVAYSDVGAMVRGAAPVGTSGRVTYDVWGVNGLAGDAGGSIRDMRDNVVDVDNNIAVGGRLGFVSSMGFDIGASAYNGTYNDEDDLNLRILGVDASYRRGSLEVRGEWMSASQGATDGDDLTKSGYYLLGSYLVRPAVEVAARYSAVEFPAESGDRARISVGLNLYPSDAAAFRFAYNINRETGSGVTSVKNNSFIAQFTVGF
ncbi:MAG: hypothetical protein HY705_00285 [Gemmatimonadetes bacterium]|nr:hypothetical protein [Gemmatimonadota bacterium]